MSRNITPKVCILSSVHSALDNRIFYREAYSLQQAGYKVSVIALHDRNVTIDGIQIMALPQLPRWQRPLLWLILLRLALTTQADVFHFHDPELLLVVPWLRLLTRKPAIYDIHEVYADFIKIKRYLPIWMRYSLAWLFNWLEPLLARLQSALIFADNQIAANFRHVQRPKIILFNYPSLSFIENAIKTTNALHYRQPVILHLGSQEQSRGTFLTIEAFHQVLQQVPEAKLLLVGPFHPTTHEEEIKSKIVRKGMTHAVTITGKVPFYAVGTYLSQAAVGWIPLQMLPKYQKNIPTKLFEYMAYGLPIVCSNLIPCRPYIKNGETGYLVQADDPGAHAQAIIKLLREPELALAMGRKGQELVQTSYNWNEMERRLLMLYNQILSKRL